MKTKKILNMTLRDSESVNRLMYIHKSMYTTKVETTEFSCRYTFPNTKTMETVTAMIDCSMGNKGIEIAFAQEASALMINKRLPSFDMLATIEGGKIKIIRQPKSAEARAWLAVTGNNRTIANELLHVVLHASVALGPLESVLQKRYINDIIEYRFPNNFTQLADEYLNHMEFVENKEKALNGWDIVTLTENQYYKVIETNIKNKVEYDMDNIPLPKFCLSIYDGKETDYYFFEKKGNTIHCGVTDPLNFATKFFDVIITGKTADGIASQLHVDDNEKNLWNWLNEPCGKRENGEPAEDANWEWCADAFFIINTFMLHFGENTMEVETKVANASAEPHNHSKRNGANTVRLFKSYKLIKNWTSKARKPIEYTCEAWGVRGHFRTLKNGKRIFVEAYVKGKNKGQYKGKEYSLLPYKEA